MRCNATDMNTLQGPITAIHPQCAVEAAMPRFTASCKSGDKNAPIVGKRGCQKWYRRSTAWNTQEKQYRRLGGGGCCGARPRRLEHVRIHLSFAVPLPVGERQGEARQEQAGQQMRAVRRSQWPRVLVLGIYPTPHMYRLSCTPGGLSPNGVPARPKQEHEACSRLWNFSGPQTECLHYPLAAGETAAGLG